MCYKLPLPLLLMIASLLISCGSDDEPQPPAPKPEPEKPIVDARIPIRLSLNMGTRATDASFETGDAVGLYVVNYNGATAGSLTLSGNHVNNMRFVFSTAWTPDQPIYWKDDVTPADFYVYYPYSAVTNIAAHPFAVQTDQSTETGYKQSEFLWGKTANVAPTESTVGVTTRHLFSNAIVKLVAGDGFTQEQVDASGATVKLLNVVVQSQIHLATGTATAAGTASTIQMRDEGTRFRALVVPQSVTAGTPLVTVKMEGLNYTMSLAADLTFTANKQHTLTVTVKKKASGIDIGIDNWDTDDIDYGGNAE